MALGALVLLPALAPAAPAPGAPLVLGYYPYWATNPTPANIKFDRFTHIIHAFVLIGPDGAPQTRANVPSKDLVTAAHAAGTKVILGLGGGSNGASFGKMVRDPALSAAFITKISQLMADYGYDGIDIDWEYPGEGDKALLTGFVSSLRDAVKAKNPNGLLVMALPKGNYYGQWYDVEAIKDKLDFVQIMTYDMHGPWTPHAGYNSSLYPVDTDKVDGKVLSFDASVDYWLKRGFGSNQLLAGIPCYARGFNVAAWGDKQTAKSAYEELSYKQIPAMLGKGWVREWDPVAAVPWLRQPGGNELISYEDEVSATLKGAWAKTKGVRGIFFWAIDQDFMDGDNKIVAAAQAGWARGGDVNNPGIVAMRASGIRPVEVAAAK